MKYVSRIRLTLTFVSVWILIVTSTFTVGNSELAALAQAKHNPTVADKSKTSQSNSKSVSPEVAPANFKQESDEILSRCRTLFNQRDYSTVESLLKKELPAVRKYGSHDAILPKYLGVIGSCCYFERRYKEAVTYLQEAIKINAALPLSKRITQTALFSDQSYLGMSLQEMEQYSKATEHFRKAIELADGLPATNPNWLKLCYMGLIYCLRRDGKYEEVLKYKERMSKIK